MSREFWPRQTDDPTGVSDSLNAVQEYVVSSMLVDPGWGHTTVLRGDLVDEVAAGDVLRRDGGLGSQDGQGESGANGEHGTVPTLKFDLTDADRDFLYRSGYERTRRFMRTRRECLNSYRQRAQGPAASSA